MSFPSGLVIDTPALVGSLPGVQRSPASIANLALWYDASQITGLADGVGVASWTDLSANANHAIQPTGIKQPLYKVNIQNGRPGVLFDVVDDGLQTTNNLTANVPGMTIFAVARSASNFGTIIENSTNFTTPLGFLVGRDSSDRAQAVMAGAVGNASTHSGTTTISTTRLLSVVFDKSLTSGESRLYSNGTDVSVVAVDSNNADTILATASKINLGARNNGTATWLNGYLHEVLLYLRALPTGERQAIESYLRKKWGAT